MKAATFLAPGKISVSSRDIPICKPGDILVKLSFASLCASDIRVYRGEKYAKKGIIPGHEFSGIIVESKSSNKKFKIGERITVCPIISCGICNFCINGMRNRCLDRKTMGYEEAHNEDLFNDPDVVNLRKKIKAISSEELAMARPERQSKITIILIFIPAMAEYEFIGGDREMTTTW